MSIPKPTDDDITAILAKLSIEDQTELICRVLHDSYAHLINQPWVMKWINKNALMISEMARLETDLKTLAANEPQPPKSFLKWRAQKDADRQTLNDAIGRLQGHEELCQAVGELRDRKFR